jgi:predicted TIM-barrel enzyme
MNMVKRFERDEIILRLKEKINTKKIIFCTSTGLGIAAKTADESGVDLIITHKEVVFAADGRVPAFARAGYGKDCNEVMLETGPAILACAQNTPVIVGVGIAEPYMNIDRLTDRFLDMGFSGVTHIPTSGGWVGPYGEGISNAEVGYTEEMEYIKKCSERGIFTLGYCFTEEQAVQMAATGASVISAYVPRMKEESHGWKAADSMQQALETGVKLCEAIKKENPEAIILCCGGNFDTAEDVKHCISVTGAYGYIGDEWIEGRHIEDSVGQAVAGYKALKLS